MNSPQPIGNDTSTERLSALRSRTWLPAMLALLLLPTAVLWQFRSVPFILRQERRRHRARRGCVRLALPAAVDRVLRIPVAVPDECGREYRDGRARVSLGPGCADRLARSAECAVCVVAAPGVSLVRSRSRRSSAQPPLFFKSAASLPNASCLARCCACPRRVGPEISRLTERIEYARRAGARHARVYRWAVQTEQLQRVWSGDP
jgi:hypothetical protein